jgi:hypothetical protein
MTSADLSAGALAKAGRPMSARDRVREIAAILAHGVLRLKTWPANPPSPRLRRASPSEKPPRSPQISLDVRRDIGPHVADG